jgi:eukaryotic-like serine/threonine-protein kinase
MERSQTTQQLATAALAEGLVLGRYRLERRLGAGGYGVVWLAHDEKLQREVAVKVIPRDEGAGSRSARAEREARVAAQLNHPGIVALYELGADADATYIVSELVSGRTFAELARAGALSDRDMARIGLALCDALAHAHARGVIHRDVKPQNVLVVSEPAAGAGFAKLADFGVAHMAEGDALTRTGDVVGTLAYMAPEQADGQRVTDAADVYSLALTLYEGWTGLNPVRARGPAATARRLGRPLPPLRGRRRDLPAELGHAIDLALDPRPERRLPIDALRDVLADVEPELSDDGGLVEPGTLERFGLSRHERRRPAPPRGFAGVLARVAAGALAGALGLGALYGLGPDPSFSPLAAAGACAATVTLLPRAAWIASVLVLCGWLASPDAGREGSALIVLAACAPVPLLLPRAGLLWSVPALAPLLGTAALAPVYVAVAGFASTAWRRAGLAAAGFVWLAAAELLTGRSLLFGVPDGALTRSLWEDSVTGAAGDALYPLVTSPALAPLAVWAAMAVLLPLCVRGRSLALDALRGGLWAAALVTLHAGLADLMAPSVALDDARGAVGGAIAGLVAAVAAAALAAPRQAPDASTVP